MEIDLHGQLESEARVNFQIFLVECKVKKVKYARVSHGYGDQILSSMIRNILTDFPYVDKFYNAHPSDGGAGITLIEFVWN